MNIVVIGAGIAGLAAAGRLAASGRTVTVLERSTEPREEGYMIDFFGPGYDAAASMGLTGRLHELGYRVDGLSYVDESGRERARLDVDAVADVVDRRFVSVMRPDLERALRESLPDTVDLRYGADVRDVDPDTGRVTLDGGTLDADLVVAADGIHSRTRRAVVGDVPLRHLGFHTAAFLFRDASVHARLGDRFHLTDTLDRQMGFYALRDGRVAVFAVHRDDDPVRPTDVRAELRRRYGDLGWIVPAALDACPEPSHVYYDVVAQVEPPTWSRGRVVLAGDAAAAVSLLAGQGASMAVAGAFVLVDSLDAHDDVPAALADHERRWRPVVTDVQRAGRSAANWFLPRTRAQMAARRVVLKASRLPFVDRLIASGIIGKPSRLVADIAASKHG